ncbi:MAG: prolipoprotein diacylglyceryl transferase [Egibacteraceae bacterium]
MLRWPILERIPLVGELEISPHGIGVALGFLMGAQLMLYRAQLRGVARKPIGESVELVMQAIVTRAAIGAILGARFFYVAIRLQSYDSVLDMLRIWEGGLSILGGITGALVLCVPYVLRRGYSVRLLLDSFAPGMALGIFIGRIGDLVIGEHLGGQTDFILGWRCTGALRDAAAPYAFTGPAVQGCFDTAVHQTALYDMIAGGVLLAVILFLERKPRFDGFAGVTFFAGYGVFRFVSDFAREADKDLFLTLTGSQLTALAMIGIPLLWIALARPQRRRPWAWCPPDFPPPFTPEQHAGGQAAEDSQDRSEPVTG